MGLLAWFNPFAYGKKPPSTDYESVLSHLSLSITEAKTHLSEIRLRQRRLSLLIITYGVILWVIWVGLFWLGAIPWGLVGVEDGGVMLGLEVVGILGGPIGLLFLNRLVKAIYNRQRVKEEANLRKLLTTQHNKLEEVKKATNYYATKELLEKYDDSPSQRNQPDPSARRPAPNSSLPNGPQGTPTPASRLAGSQQQQKGLMMGGVQGVGTPVGAGGNGAGAGGVPGLPRQPLTPQQMQQIQMLQQSSSQMQMQPVLPTPQKKWYDHLADKLMGEDPSTALQNKYALVCARCFRHNGLVGSKDEWEGTKWYCRNCNFFNMAPRDRKPGSKPPGADSNPSTPVEPTFPSTSAAIPGLPARSSTPQVLEDSGKDVSTTARDGTREESTRKRSVRRKGEVGDVSDDRMDVDD